MIGFVNEKLMNRILTDQALLANFSEFRKLQKQYIAVTSGCGSCAKKRKYKVKFREFCAILFNMPQSRLDQLKKHLGLEKLQYSGYNPKTNSVGVFEL